MLAVEDRHGDETEGKGQYHCCAEKEEVGWPVIGAVRGQWSFLRNSVGGWRLYPGHPLRIFNYRVGKATWWARRIGPLPPSAFRTNAKCRTSAQVGGPDQWTGNDAAYDLVL
jgi:hypothetical protein